MNRVTRRADGRNAKEKACGLQGNGRWKFPVDYRIRIVALRPRDESRGRHWEKCRGAEYRRRREPAHARCPRESPQAGKREDVAHGGRENWFRLERAACRSWSYSVRAEFRSVNRAK